MGEGYNFAQLRERILSISKAADWETARKEWALVAVWEAAEPQECLCGHYPIVEICEIHSRITDITTEVGNVCVKRFLGIRSDLIFSALKRIGRDATKSLNSDAIVFFKERGLLNDWEYEFSQGTSRKRSLSERQLAYRIAINTKVLTAIKKRGFKGPE